MKTMRLIERIVCSFVLLALLTGCDNKIESPGDTESPEPDLGDVRYIVTASMLSTKVSYSDKYLTMKYAWESSDIGRTVVVSDGENSYDFVVKYINNLEAVLCYSGEIANPTNFTGTATLSRDPSPSKQTVNGNSNDKSATAHLGNGEIFIANLEDVNFDEPVNLSFKPAKTSLYRVTVNSPIGRYDFESDIPVLWISAGATQIGKVELDFIIGKGATIIAYLRCAAIDELDSNSKNLTFGLEYEGKVYTWSKSTTLQSLAGGNYYIADLTSKTPEQPAFFNIEVLSTTTDFFD